MASAKSNVVKTLFFSFFLLQMILFCSSVAVYDLATFGDVSCNHSGITVDISLSEDFRGIIYPQGHFLNPNCSYISTVPTRKNVTILYPLTECGTLVEDKNGILYISNQVVIQKNRYVETIGDAVRMVQCQLFHPSNEDIEELLAGGNHYKNNVFESWMEFRLGPSILGKDVSNYLMVGDEFLIMIYLKDGGINGDLKVESCWAYEGETKDQSEYFLPIYDSHSCESSDLISDFNLRTGTRNVSDFMTYAVVKAFKFPMTDYLHITCSIQVCKQSCPDYCRISESERSNAYPRISRRSTSEDLQDKSLREKYELMKATVKVLRAKLIEGNRTHGSSENLGFRQRISSSETSTASNYEDVAAFEKYDDYPKEYILGNHERKNYSEDSEFYANRMYFFYLTNKLVVFQNHNSTHDYIHPFDNSFKYVSRLKFIIPIAVLFLICLFLLLACFILFLNLRQERKRRKIDCYMMYSISNRERY